MMQTTFAFFNVILIGAIALSIGPRPAEAVTIVRSFTTDVPVSQAIAWTGSTFFATAKNDTINQFDLNGSLISSFASPTSDGNDLERGLAYDGSSLWLFNRYTSDSTQSMFYELDPLTGQLLSSFFAPKPTANLFGLTFNGSNLIGTRFTSGDLVEIGQTDGQSTLITNGNSLIGLGYDGSNYLSIDLNYPTTPLNQAYVRIDPVSGDISAFDSRDPSEFASYVFTSMGSDRWLLRQGFTSTSNVMAEAIFDWQIVENNGRPVPEPSSLALFGLGLTGLWFARRKTI